MESIPDLPSLTIQSGERGDLTIGRHSPSGDPPDDRVDALIVHGAEIRRAASSHLRGG